MIKKELFIGITVGLIANAIGLISIATLLGQGEDFTTVIKAAYNEGFLGKLISLGAVLNLIAFFIFIRKRQDYRARGVLIITIFVAVFTFIFKLF
ncbi:MULTISPECIES: hypothetical protein [Aestuariibaculum]|uniref:Uncharacterized protein n=1 Tax=Aestuariibaculum lutulentum TaxID=2920935 RepID=A0ABS9RKW4_9FLAO|nr:MULTISPECIES: hypothetical protein [Aestuariibaculum]MCH4553583.1 hypothetical protein [Aestuariibaculum lutulentum]MCR8668275.1 hypothetical protein [Aestuariibaculum sp. M13]